ncbi:MAG: imidazole glycerol phosphate synthase subunit HisH [Myxococcales bacterium]|nr:imidazole glycerol phosphate synthase subunit HisH [Myxococcales bacterium]
MDVTIVDHGAGNLASVLRALAHVGARPTLTSDPALVARAERLVVPGQGAFPDAMRRLRSLGLDDAIRSFVATERPYLGICLGLQLLFDEGHEHGVTPGLGILPGRCRALRADGLKVPHMGWNTVERDGPGGKNAAMAGIADGEYFYFVHSFIVEPAAATVGGERAGSGEPLEVLWSTHGERFPAAVARGALLACQFHPEKSQQAGLRLLGAFCR